MYRIPLFTARLTGLGVTACTLSAVPRFIDNLALRTVAWLIGEVVFLALDQINRKLDILMVDVTIAQETLDADGDALTQLAADLHQIIASGTLAPADQAKLQAGIAALTALDTLTVTPPVPVPPPVVPPTGP